MIASDNCGPPTVLLTSVASNEPDNAVGTGDGDTINDIQDAELGTADFNFKLASSYSSMEEFGKYFQWNRDMQGYLKRNELFGGLLDCNVARAYTGDTLVNTLTTE